MKLRLCIPLIALAVMALPSFAQEDGTRLRTVVDETGETQTGWYDSGSYALGTYLDNPCTAAYDEVLVDYNVYLAQEGTAADTGERVLFDESTTMGGDKYAASGSSLSDVTYQLKPYTLRKYYKVNTPDNFHVVTVIDFDPASKSTSVSLETACGDGTPSSAQ